MQADGNIKVCIFLLLLTVLHQTVWFHTIYCDVRYFYKIFAEVSAGCGRMQDLCGLAYFDKRAILYGSEGSVRVFSSQSGSPNPKTMERSNKPEAVVDSCAAYGVLHQVNDNGFPSCAA